MLFLATSNITEATGISLGVLLGVVGLIATIGVSGIGVLGWIVRLMWHMSNRLDQLVARVDRIVDKHWTLDDQIEWDREYREKNPDTPLPDAYRIFKKNRHQ